MGLPLLQMRRLCCVRGAAGGDSTAKTNPLRTCIAGAQRRRCTQDGSMRLKVWGLSTLGAAIAVTSFVVTPLPAQADGLRFTYTNLTCEKYVGVGDFNRCTVTVIDTDPSGAAAPPTGGANVTM